MPLDLPSILARAEAATPGPWTFDIDAFGGGRLAATEADHAFILHARTDIPALCAEVARLRAALSWQESRHGTQAEQEREEAETAAEMDAIDAMSEEQVAAELREAGVDVEAGRERCEALVRVVLERNRLVDVAREGRAFTAALSKLLGDAGLLEDGPIHEAHLTAVRKLIERIASLETAASAVVEATASKPALVRITTTISPDGVYASGVMTAMMPAETGDCRTCQWACNLSSGEPGCGHPDRHKDDAWAGGNVPPTFAWSNQHLGADEMTRIPNSPPCPGHKEK